MTADASTDAWIAAPGGEVRGAAGSYTVTPDTDLDYTEVVTVDATGYAPNTVFGFLQCVAGATDIGECASATLRIGSTDGTGAFSGTTTVRRNLVTASGTTDCATAPGTCVIGAGPSLAEALANPHPLAFDPSAPVPPPPSIAATPDTGVGLTADVQVTGSGFVPGGYAAIRECVAGSSSFSDCSEMFYEYAEVDPSGAIDTTVEVRRGIRTANAPVIDCADAPGCMLVAFDEADPALRGEASLTFDPSVPLPPAPVVTAEPSTGLADHQLITVSATGFTPGTGVYLGQCRAESTSSATCGPVLGQAAGPDGSVSATFRVRQTIGNGVDCAAAPGECVAFATAVDDVFAHGSVPLTFDPDAPPIAPPTLTFTPTTDLVDGQTVTVTGAGFAPGESVALVQCRGGDQDQSGAHCDLPHTLVYRTADAEGVLLTTLTARLLLTTSAYGTIDCATVVEGCIFGWGLLGDLQWGRGNVPITFTATELDAATTRLAATGAGRGTRTTAGLGAACVVLGALCLLAARRRRHG